MIIGIICEYNPFHNGHIYHLNKIKEMYPNCLIILVMSGNITQRGDISIINKWDKTEIALSYGIDLIVELPFNYASQSADIFAKGALEILNELKIDTIVFGSELNNPDVLKKLAKIQLSDEYSKVLKNYVDKYSYPEACSKALLNISKQTVNTPNDILGLSYIKEIIKNNYKINIKTIKRTNDYNSKKLEEIASATSIREAIKNEIKITNYVPKICLKKIDKNLILDNYFDIIKYKIISTEDLTYIHSIDEKLNPRLKEKIEVSNSLEEYIQNVKTKKYSYNRIRRILIYILLDFKKTDYKDINFIRILGFNNKGKKYLSSIKKDIKLKIITNYSNSKGLIDLDLKIDNILSLKTKKELNKEKKEVIRKRD